MLKKGCHDFSSFKVKFNYKIFTVCDHGVIYRNFTIHSVQKNGIINQHFSEYAVVAKDFNISNR